uniref:Toxin-antitoxin system YwqK family antitoxin n=1 Tax=Prevotella sp. GTC17259 TaxID=3236795 RepID=A0AB33J460_9BACT
MLTLKVHRCISVFFLLCLNLSAFAQKVILSDELLTMSSASRRNVYCEKLGKQPLQGEYRIKRGLDEECVVFDRGLMNGAYRRYRDGALREKGVYSAGKRNGLFTEYFQDGMTPSKTTPMNRGKIDGCVKTYFRNGGLASEKEFRQSIEHGVERRYDDRTRAKVLEIHWANGKKEGTEWKLTEQGGGVQTRTVRTYRGGVLHGLCREEVWRHGKTILVVEGQYADGERSGKWKKHDATTGQTREWNE